MWASKPGKPDSTATRFAELYAQALDRLADPRSPMRVGALHTLETLGRDNAAGRPAIVDVICAYLRISGDGDLSVRATAQQILTTHLRRGGRGFWRGVSLDLRGAVLTNLDLSGCRIDGDLQLDRAALHGPVKLRELSVAGTTSMRGAVFGEHVWLERSTFHGPLYLDRATFQQDAWFGNVHFGGPCSFVGTEFTGHAWFGGATFHGLADFADALFRRSAGFRGAVVGPINLAGTTFLGPARVSRREETWNVAAPGWAVVVDPDNGAVGQLLWVGEAYRQPFDRQPDEQVTPV
jgi:hypothetical protein